MKAVEPLFPGEGDKCVFANVAGGQLGAEVAKRVAGDSDVAFDQVENRLDRTSRGVELERRDAQPFLVDFRGVASVSAGNPAADIGMMCDGGRESEQAAIDEHGFVDVQVGQVRATFIRIIEQKHIAVVNGIAIPIEDGGETVRQASQMQGKAETLRNQPTTGVAEAGGEVHRISEIG